MNEAKAVLYFQEEVSEASNRVKANKGAAGVDERSIEDFESPSRSRVRRRIGSGA
jgi:hypothetical protein